jgi:ubiquinone/menaquinone biosynthesis C-methylase UbiE
MHSDENRQTYERRSLAAHYARQSGLQPDEIAILRRYKTEFAGRQILDVGVGGGRTTPFLTELSADYTGVDYSNEMIDRCRRRLPTVRFVLADARDLSAFDDAAFDSVLFSNNGIDAAGHDDRLTILREMHRLLKDGGLLVFSSHNRNFSTIPPWQPSHLAINPLRHPVRFARRCVALLSGMVSYWRRARRNEVRDEYCILVDSAHRYSLSHYRITASAQVSQLGRIGFDAIELVGNDGHVLSSREADASADPWIHYVCRKLELPSGGT